MRLARAQDTFRTVTSSTFEPLTLYEPQSRAERRLLAALVPVANAAIDNVHAQSNTAKTLDLPNRI